jgi:hypothetical protein
MYRFVCARALARACVFVIYMFSYIYIALYIYIATYIYIYIYVLKYMWIQSYLCMRVYIYLNVYIICMLQCVCMPVYVSIYVPLYLHTLKYTHTHTPFYNASCNTASPSVRYSCEAVLNGLLLLLSPSASLHCALPRSVLDAHGALPFYAAPFGIAFTVAARTLTVAAPPG